MKFLGGEKYEGEWLDNKPHGKGKLILRDESSYEGGKWHHLEIIT